MPRKPTCPVEPNLRTSKRNSAGGSQDFTRDPQHQRKNSGDNMPAQRSRLGNPTHYGVCVVGAQCIIPHASPHRRLPLPNPAT